MNKLIKQTNETRAWKEENAVYLYPVCKIGWHRQFMNI